MSKPVSSISDRVLGIIGGGMALGAVYLLIVGGLPDGSAAPPDVPKIEITSPADDDVLPRPVEVRFQMDAPLSHLPGGWVSGVYHLHADLLGREVMPGAEDIRRLPDGAYAWTFPDAPPGEATLRLFWADQQHRPVPSGSTQFVTFTAQ